MHHLIATFAQTTTRFPKLWGALKHGENLQLYLDIAYDALLLANTSRPELKHEENRITVVSSMIKVADNSPRPKGTNENRIINMIGDVGKDKGSDHEDLYDEACEFVARVVVGHEYLGVNQIVQTLNETE